MFDIKISFLSILADLIGKEEITLSVDEKATIKDIIKTLTSKFSKEFEKIIFDAPDNLSKYIIIALNGKEIRLNNDLNLLIHENDEIVLLPAIAGG